MPCTIPRSANAASIAAAGWAASIPSARARITPGGVGIDEGRRDAGFFLFGLRFPNELVQARGDLRRLGILELIDPSLDFHLGRLVDVLEDLHDPLEIAGRIRDQQAVGPLDRLDFSIAVDKSLDQSLRLGDLDVLERDNLADQLVRVLERFLRHLPRDRHRLLPSGGRLDNLEKFFAHGHQRDVVHRQDALDGLQSFLLRQPRLAAQGNGRVDAGRLDQGATGDFAVELQDLVERRVAEIQRYEFFAAARGRWAKCR